MRAIVRAANAVRVGEMMSERVRKDESRNREREGGSLLCELLVAHLTNLEFVEVDIEYR